MKRRTLAALLAVGLSLTLCGCGGDRGEPTPAGTAAEPPFAVEGTARALLDSGAYTDVEDMEPPLAAEDFFDLLDADTVTAGAVYSSTYLAEVAAVVVFADEDAARAGMAVLERWVADRKEAERDYRPAEVPKLEKAVLERRGISVVLAVASDGAKARDVISGWGK